MQQQLASSDQLTWEGRRGRGVSHIWALLLHMEPVWFYQVLLKSQNLERQVTHRENKGTGPGSDLFHMFIWETAYGKAVERGGPF